MARSPRSKQITVRISDGADAAIGRIMASTDASQSTVVRAMLAYSIQAERDVEAMIRNYRLVEL